MKRLSSMADSFYTCATLLVPYRLALLDFLIDIEYSRNTVFNDR